MTIKSKTHLYRHFNIYQESTKKNIIPKRGRNTESNVPCFFEYLERISKQCISNVIRNKFFKGLKIMQLQRNTKYLTMTNHETM